MFFFGRFLLPPAFYLLESAKGMASMWKRMTHLKKRVVWLKNCVNHHDVAIFLWIEGSRRIVRRFAHHVNEPVHERTRNIRNRKIDIILKIGGIRSGIVQGNTGISGVQFLTIDFHAVTKDCSVYGVCYFRLQVNDASWSGNGVGIILHQVGLAVRHDRYPVFCMAQGRKENQGDKWKVCFFQADLDRCGKSVNVYGYIREETICNKRTDLDVFQLSRKVTQRLFFLCCCRIFRFTFLSPNPVFQKCWQTGLTCASIPLCNAGSEIVWWQPLSPITVLIAWNKWHSKQDC